MHWRQEKRALEVELKRVKQELEELQKKLAAMSETKAAAAEKQKKGYKQGSILGSIDLEEDGRPIAEQAMPALVPNSYMTWYQYVRCQHLGTWSRHTRADTRAVVSVMTLTALGDVPSVVVSHCAYTATRRLAHMRLWH